MTEMVQGSEVIISNVEPQEDIKHPLNIFYVEKRVNILTFSPLTFQGKLFNFNLYKIPLC